MSEAHGIELGNAIYGHADPTNWVDGGSSLTADELSKAFDRDPDNAEVAEPVGVAIAKAKLNQLNKTSTVADARWDEPFAKAAPSTTLPERSKARFERFERVCATVFGNSEEYAEAIKIARETVNAERAAIILASAGG